MEAIREFVARERAAGAKVYPPDDQVFAALELTPFESVGAVILGQDPYHHPGQAHGLAFSTRARSWPPSLQNILEELHCDCGYEKPESGSLEPWARNGVLLLNVLLTVGEKAGSHEGQGWEQLTGALVDTVAAKPGPIAFLLWGKAAIRKGRHVHHDRHVRDRVVPSVAALRRTAMRQRTGLPWQQAIQLCERRASEQEWPGDGLEARRRLAFGAGLMPGRRRQVRCPGPAASD